MLEPNVNCDMYFRTYHVTETHVAIVRNDPEAYTAGLPRIRLIFIAPWTRRGKLVREAFKSLLV